MTINYSENIKHVAGLQVDSRRDRGDRIDLVDQLLGLVRELSVTEKGVFDLQNYYFKTIARKTAFHGITGKLFSINGSNLELLVTWSQDCQYPLELFVFDSGYIVGHVLTLKQIEAHYKALSSLSVSDLAKAIDQVIVRYTRNYNQIKAMLSSAVTSKHFRYYRKQCLDIVKQFS
jgi:hypothetical protein